MECNSCTNLKIKNANNLYCRLLALFFVVSPGFEPRQAEPKTAVLPLHHETITIFAFFSKSGAKIHFFLRSSKFLCMKIYTNFVFISIFAL